MNCLHKTLESSVNIVKTVKIVNAVKTVNIVNTVRTVNIVNSQQIRLTSVVQPQSQQSAHSALTGGTKKFFFFYRFFCINPLLIGRYDDSRWVPRGTQPIFGVFGGSGGPSVSP